MSEAFVDTDIIIRFVTGDDPVKQAAATALFRQVQSRTTTLRAPDTVIADAVYVLSPRIYQLPRLRIRDELSTLLALPKFRVHNRRLVQRALDIYAATKLDFGDALIIATAERRGGGELYSYDHDFDNRPGIQRREP